MARGDGNTTYGSPFGPRYYSSLKHLSDEQIESTYGDQGRTVSIVRGVEEQEKSGTGQKKLREEALSGGGAGSGFQYEKGQTMSDEGGGHGVPFEFPSIISPTLPRPPRTKFDDPPQDVNTTITEEEIAEITAPAKGLESTIKTINTAVTPSGFINRPSIIRNQDNQRRSIVSVT